MYTSNEAIEKACEKLTKEELVDLICLLTDRKLKTTGRKKKVKKEV